jgi:hypothetical protein
VASAGTSKLTGVDGCDAVANAFRPDINTPAASEASTTSRLVTIRSLPTFVFGYKKREDNTDDYDESCRKLVESRRALLP